jgi:GalNAc5-diNAcBac-PP-undecaprenol beta-1,3-glucosyltransferase
MPQATVLIPTFNHGRLLLCSGRSALSQTVEDLEIFIIGDGATDETRAAARELAAEDERVRFFDNPKGPRNGELHRHEALVNEARGEVVCYLSDDDLWLPDHVETLLPLLREADFAGAFQVVVLEDGGLKPTATDISLPYYRGLMLSAARRVNRIPLSSGAHTMEMYRRLPHGWRTTPKEYATDLYMWQQFLSIPECRAASARRPTVLQFPSPARRDWSLQERLDEMVRWSEKTTDPQWRCDFIAEVLASLVERRTRHVANLEARTQRLETRVEKMDKELARCRNIQKQLHDIHNSRSWRVLQKINSARARIMGKR